MNAEINLTNLIDVAFVLLIIFMITAPILQGGIEIKLPEAEATPLNSSDAVIVSVSAAGDVFIGQTKTKFPDEFETMIGQYTGDSKKLITLKADKRVEWGRVSEVMSVMNALKITDMQIALEPKPRTR
jgi:biopolymer transport protein ExbD